MNTIISQKKRDIIFIVGTFVIIALQLWKLKFGQGFEDEYFYISIAQRICNGDALLYDEWHLAQLMGIFLAPLYSVFHYFNPANEGIIIYFRLCYVVFHTIVSIILYINIRKNYNFSNFAALLFMVYTPYQIMSLSYNTMSIDFLLLAYLLFSHRNVFCYIISGIFLSCAVLNTPYLAVIYIILFLYVMFFSKKENGDSLCDKQSFILVSIGVIISIILFVGFLLSRASLMQIAECLKYIVDPGHSNNILIVLGSNIVKTLLCFNVFIVIQTCCLFYDLKNKTNKFSFTNLIVGIISIFYSVFVRRYQYDLGGYMIAMIPLSISAIDYLYLFKDSFLNNLCLISIIHALCIGSSSNVGLRSLASPLILAVVVLVIVMGESSIKYKTGVICILLGYFIFFKATFIYLGQIKDYNYMIDNGPMKGVFVDKDYINEYELICEDVEEINSMKEENIIFISYNIWEYFMTDKNYAVQTSLNQFYSIEDYTDTIQLYLEIHDKKKPVLIYLDNDNKFSIQGNESFFEKIEFVKIMKHGKLYLIN